MSTQGQWVGDWQGAWFGASEVNPGSMSGAASLSITAAGTLSDGGQIADTHDGYWSRLWHKLKKREEKPTIAEVVEIIKESPQVLEVVRVEVERKYPQVDYAQVLANVQLQRFIARQLIEAAQDEDDLEVLLLA